MYPRPPFSSLKDSNHTSVFDVEWLMDAFDPPALQKRAYWGADLDLPTTHYDEVMQSDTGLAKWITNIVLQSLAYLQKNTYGIGFVQGCPPSPGHTATLAKRIALIRDTHYGSLWDFTSHGDTAYTKLALQAHTDTTYFTDPVGLQIFHLLKHEGSGGKSLFIDGFNCANQLKESHPPAYDILSSLRIPTQCSGDTNVHLEPNPSAYPIFNHNPVTGELFQIRFNNDDRAVLSFSLSDTRDFYHALREWMTIIKHPRNEIWTQLNAGTVVAFDNFRVLHGRSSFSGYRRMVGCYIGNDDYRSRLRVITAKR